MTGVFGADGGGHAVDVDGVSHIGHFREAIAEFHAVMPSAPDGCDGEELEGQRQESKNDKEDFTPTEQQDGGTGDPGQCQQYEQPEAVFIDKTEYLDVFGNVHGCLSW